MTIIDVSGVGKGSVFLIKGEANLLFEAGMGYAAAQMVEKIKKELGEAKVDAVLLSHSHYDHVGGLAEVRKAWPEVKTYASERAKEILVKPGALATIRRLSEEAAEASGLPWNSGYADEDLQIDVALRDGEVAEIYKYQSGDDIIREIMAVYCEVPGAGAVFPGVPGKKKRIIGVYSPIGRCGKTSLALAIGQLLAKEEKVLFITLDMFAGFSSILDERWKRDMSDLIYYYKQGRFHALRLNSVVYLLGDMAWIPPIRYPDDYNQITSEEMAEFLMKILYESDYSTVVLDIGKYDRQVLPVLNICQVIYMPIKEDLFSQAKMKEFESYVDRFGEAGTADKFQKIHIPYVTGTRRMEHFPQELLWGDMGDFVRGLLKGQRGLWEN